MIEDNVDEMASATTRSGQKEFGFVRPKFDIVIEVDGLMKFQRLLEHNYYRGNFDFTCIFVCEAASPSLCILSPILESLY